MALFSWFRWLRSLSRPRTGTYRKAAKPRKRRGTLALEHLETRLAPAVTYTWTGADHTGLWNDPLNWSHTGGSGVSAIPTGLTANQESLSFGVTASGITTVIDNLTLQTGQTAFVFDSISFSGANYTVSNSVASHGNGMPITLGDPVAGGGFNVSSTDSVSINIQLQGLQAFLFSAGSQLTLSGNLSGASTAGLTEKGPGTLILSGNNSSYVAPITIDSSLGSGTLEAESPTALGGPSSNVYATVTVDASSQLEVVNTTSTAWTLNSVLNLNGSGFGGAGAVQSISGKNTWAGNVELDADTSIGSSDSNSADYLNFTGIISDNGAGHALAKVGIGTVVLSAANTYRGQTTVTDGVLALNNSLALQDSVGTLVNNTALNQGTLQMGFNNPNSIIINNEPLTLNGSGYNGLGAIYNFVGTNFWTGANGPITLGSASGGSDPYFDANINTTLVIASLVEDFAGAVAPTGPTPGTPQTGNHAHTFNKTGNGTVILSHANSYIGYTNIQQGILEITDSTALGPITGAVTQVDRGATLELSVDPTYKTTADSVTGNFTSLNVQKTVFIVADGYTGSGSSSPLGAIYSASGINFVTGHIDLFGTEAGIGVAIDPNGSTSSSYITNDYSLTVTGGINTINTQINNPINNIFSSPIIVPETEFVPYPGTLTKWGAGQLILPTDNPNFVGSTVIAQGWITIGTGLSLGTPTGGALTTLVPGNVTVDAGAALMLDPLLNTAAPPMGMTYTPIDLIQNLILAGQGIAKSGGISTFSLITDQGAVENLAGDNTLSGNIELDGAGSASGQVGIGVENVLTNAAAPTSQLTVTGAVSDYTPLTVIPVYGSGDYHEDKFIVNTFSTSGTYNLTFNARGLPSYFYAFNGGEGLSGTSLIGPAAPEVINTTTISGSFSSSSGFVEFLVNPGDINDFGKSDPNIGLGDPYYDTLAPLGAGLIYPYSSGNISYAYTYATWSFFGTLTVTPTVPAAAGGIKKYGSQELILQGAGTYSDGLDITAGVVVDENNTGLGAGYTPGSTVTIENGAALQLEVPTGNNNGTGFQIQGINLVLNGLGNNTTPLGPVAAFSLTANALNASNDNLWTGTVLLKNSAVISVAGTARLTMSGVVSDPMSTGGSTASDLIKVGTGELVLAGANTYNGVTYVGTDTTNPDGVNFFLTGNPMTAQPGGIVTVANSQGLGSDVGAVIVQNGSSLRLEGNITIAGKKLTIGGTGYPGTAVTASWFQEGPGPVMLSLGDGTEAVAGRVNGIAADPTNANTIYITTEGGGVWKTTNGGQTWAELSLPPESFTVNLPNLAILNNSGQGFNGLDFGDTQGYVPPDTNGAAGPSSYVETVNQTLAIYNLSTGNQQSVANFDDFFSSLAPADGGSGFSDPIVVYDDNMPGLTPTTGRFIVGDQNVDFGTGAGVFDIAVSKTSTPGTLTSADWNFYQISTDESGFYADYPGNFGYNHDAFVYTLNMFTMGSGTAHVLVTSINAADLASGASQATITANTFQTDIQDFSVRAATMHNATAGAPMWLVSQTGDGQHINVYEMTNELSATPTITETQIAVNPYTDVSEVPPLQPDGTAVTTNIDSRILKVAVEGNTLVATHSVAVSGTENDAQWYEINLTGGTPVLQQQGDVSMGNNTYIYYPSIDINSSGNFGMTFMESGTGAGQFMSMYVTGRQATDPAGTMATPVLVPTGTGIANYTDFASPHRAGDLSGINVNPSTGSFWAVNEFADNESSGANWGTAVANFSIGSGGTEQITVTPGLIEGAITVAPAPNSQTLYVGTGNSSMSIAGTGVYKSTDGGQTWQLVVGDDGSNPISGQAVSQIAVDPSNPGIIYVATSNWAPNDGSGPPSNIVASTKAGIWEFNGTTWTDLTAQVSSVRAANSPAPLGPGPDDNLATAFQTSDADYSSVVVMNNPVLAGGTYASNFIFFALATPDGGPLSSETTGTTTTTGFDNAVFISTALSTNGTRLWLQDSFTSTDIVASGTNAGPYAHSGTINLAAGYSNSLQFTLYASVVYADDGGGYDGYNAQFQTWAGGALREIDATTITWTPSSSTAPALAPGFGTGSWVVATWKMGAGAPGSGNLPSLNSLGDLWSLYNAIAVDPNNPNIVYLGGIGAPFMGGPFKGTFSGGSISWQDLSTGLAVGGNIPYPGYHAFAFSPNGDLLVGSEGGIWSLSNSTSGQVQWNDLNSDLDISLVNSVAVNPLVFPGSPGSIFAGLQAGGIAEIGNTPAWNSVYPPSYTANGTSELIFGGQVAVNPLEPNNVYASYETRQYLGNTNNLFTQGAVVTALGSTNGGGSWSNIGASTVYGNFPFDYSYQTGVRVDPLSPNRVLVANAFFDESVNFGNSFNSILNVPTNVLAFAISAYQGAYVAEPGDPFPTVSDIGSNTYDPNTIYVTDNHNIYVTKDHGINWEQRNLPSGNTSFITDLEVDPTNRDTVYALRNTTDGREVWLSTDAGRDWTNVTPTGLTAAAWKLAIDARTGTLYLATSNGIYTATPTRPTPTTLNLTSSSWSLFDVVGLPGTLDVRDIELNTTLNSLTIGTYGRGVYQLLLEMPYSGASLGVVGGSVTFIGPINLTGPTAISALGGFALQNATGNIANTQLNFAGVIADDPSVANPQNNTLTINPSAFGSNIGTIIFSGPNTYQDSTDIQTGVLVADNLNALGAGGTTTVENGASLELESSLTSGPIHLNGNGFEFNGHFTGSLRNIANSNLLNSQVQLESNATIAVDSGSQLTIGGGSGTITDGGIGYSVIKESTGTLVLANADSYGSGGSAVTAPVIKDDPTAGSQTTYAVGTVVVQGALDILNAGALGNSGNTTTVLDGAQLQIGASMPASLPAPIDVENQTLDVTGTGINNTGAVENLSGNNIWGGPVILDTKAGFTPTTSPANAVTFNLLNPDGTDSLTINGQITGSGLGLTKAGPGLLILTNNTNSYGGVTTVLAGILQIDASSALGAANGLAATGTIVQAGAALQLAGGISVGDEALQLNGTGVNNNGALENFTGSNSWGGPITLVTSSSIGVDGSNLEVQSVTVNVVSGTFQLIVTVNGGVTQYTTAALAVGATAAQVEEAINAALPTGAFVTVTKVGNAYQVVFQGTMAQNAQSLITSPTPAAVTAVETEQGGNGYLAVTGTGTILGANTSSLTKVGPGTLSLQTADSYLGSTAVQGGVLDIANALSLGALENEVQTINVSGSGTFKLSFDGTTFSSALTINSSLATSIRNAIAGLLGTSTANIVVTGPSGGGAGLYTITFQGALAGTSFPLLQTGSVSATATIVVGMTTVGGQLTNATQTLTIGGSLTGSFKLKFNNVTTATAIPTNISDPTLASQIQAALAALSDIGANNVIVTGSNGTYTVIFVGSLGGQSQNLIVPTAVTGGSNVVVSSAVVGGLGGTAVNSGATLEVQGGINVTTEPLQLNGSGYDGIGALEGSGASANTWSAGIALEGGITTTAIAADFNSTLNVAQISEAVTGSQLTKIGDGTLAYTGAIQNTYTGQTTVEDGTLLLSKTVNGAALDGGSLVIGNNPLADTPVALVQETTASISQINNSALAVTVNPDGQFDLNGKTDVIGSLSIIDGLVTTGASGHLTPSALTMTGGTLNIGSGGQVTLVSDVTGQADASGLATGAAMITGAGTLLLHASMRTFTVNGPGAQAPAPDMVISAVLSGTSGQVLNKSGTGTLQITTDEATTFTGTTDVSQGTLLADGPNSGSTLGSISLLGGTLGGTGTVGAVTPDASLGGTLAPGDGPNSPVLPLTIGTGGTETLNEATSLYVVLNAPDTNSSTPGTGHSVLKVNGNLNLNPIGTSLTGVTLTGLVGPNVMIGDSFTIITATGTISGHFAELYSPDTVFIDGQKFHITYNTNSVVLTRIKENLNSFTLVSSAPGTSIYRDDVIFTATVTPEPGATIPSGPSGAYVTFVLDAGPGQITQNVYFTSGQTVVTFNPDPSGTPLSLGMHTVSATFTDPTNSFNSDTATPNPLNQDVVQATATVSISSSAPTSVYGQDVVFTATVTPQNGVPLPAGTSVTFTLDAGSNPVVQTVVLNSQDKATFDPQTLNQFSWFVTSHMQTVTVNGTSGTFTLTFKNQMTSALAFNAPATGTNSVQSALDALSSIGGVGGSVTVTQVGNVYTVIFGGTLTGSDQPVMTALGSANAVVALGAHTVDATLNDSTGVFEAASALTFHQIVNLDPTTISVVASAQAQTITVNGSGSFELSFDGVTFSSALTINSTLATSIDTALAALLSTSPSNILVSGPAGGGAGTYYVSFQGTLAGDSFPLLQTGSVSSTATVTTQLVVGNSVTVTATITPSLTPTTPNFSIPGGVPGSLVTFTVDNTPQSPVILQQNGTAVLVLNSLGVSLHMFQAAYSGDSDYSSVATTSNVNVNVVKANPAIQVTALPTSTVYGQQVTFTATLSGFKAPTGTVTFYDGAPIQANRLGLATLTANGSSASASLPISTLVAASHNINVTYAGDVNYNSTSFDLSNFVVNPIQTQTALTSSTSGNPSGYGMVVTFTATVTDVAPGTLPPAGTVTFTDTSTNNVVSTVALNTSGVATYATNALILGINNITATFNPAANFSTSTGLLTQDVQAGSTITVNSPSSSVFGQSVAITAVVNGVPQNVGTPTGSVGFYDGAIMTADLLGSLTLSNGSATLNISTLNLGAHHINVAYSGDNSFTPSTTGTATNLTVSAANTTTTIMAVPSTAVYGQSVTFTANVAVTSPGGGMPSGSVAFYDGVIDSNHLLGTGLLNHGAAFLNYSGLTTGAHNIIASYGGNTDFTGSTTNSPASVTVNQASTNTTIMAAPSSPTFGQSVTLTATVTIVSPGNGSPTGSVVFYDGPLANNSILGTMTLTSGTATINVSSLTAGGHSVYAKYVGDAHFGGSTTVSPAGVSVGQANTTTTVSASSGTAAVGQPVTFTAHVTATSPGSGTPTGSVGFYDGTVTPSNFIGSGTLNGGTATLSYSGLGVGQHTINAQYAGDGNFAPSHSTTTANVLEKGNSSVTVFPSGTVVFGQPLAFTAQVSAVSPAVGTPTGSVGFYDGSITPGNLLGTVALSGGQATLDLSSQLTLGMHTINASYSGDTVFIANNTTTASAASVTVDQAGTTTTVGLSTANSVFGQAVTFTAQVSVVSPGSGTPAGTVTFYRGSIGGTLMGTATVNGSGLASIVLNNLPVGLRNIYAQYNGNTDFALSDSPTPTPASLTVSEANTSTAVGLSSSTSVFGQSVTLSATVTTSAPGTGTPTGTVTFYRGSIGGTTLGTATLNGGGVASLALNNLPVGQDGIFASYAGDGNYNASNSPTPTSQTVTVSQAGTTTSVNASVSSPVFGQTEMLTATVASTSLGAGTPTGSVGFYDGSVTPGHLLGSMTLNGSGQAALSITSLGVGPHSINVAYSGDTNHATSMTTTPASVTVSKAGTTTMLISSANSAVIGQQVTFTATIAVTTPGTGTTTGSVTFYDGSLIPAHILGTGTVSGGQATFSTSSLSFGSHTITAVYDGDTNFTGSTSPSLTQREGFASTTSVGVSMTSAVFGQTVTLTADVAAGPGGSGTPTGTVTFYRGSIGGTSLGTASLNGSGIAQLALNNLPVGLRNIYASYAGDSVFASSNSPSPTPASVTVNPASTTTAVGVSTTSATYGQAVTLTAAVDAVSPGSGTATGTVTFYRGSIGGTFLGSATLNSSDVASITLTNLPAGLRNIYASYAGDGNFNGSNSPSPTPASVTINAANTTTAVGASTTSSVFGQAVTLSATIGVVSPGAGTPTGTVTFYRGAIGGTVLGTATVNSSRVANLIISNLPVGLRNIYATYNGDGNFAASNSPSPTPVSVTVAQAHTTTTITSSASTSDVGQTVTFTASVTAVAPGGGTRTGTVTFFIDGAAKATVGLNNFGQAAFSTSALGVGSHKVTASYSGDSNFIASNAAAITQNVQNTATGLQATVMASPGVQVGSPFSIMVAAVNPLGQAVPGYTGTAVLTLTSAPANGGFTGPTTASFDSSGNALFNGLEVNKSGQYTFMITSGNLSTTVTFTTSGRQT